MFGRKQEATKELEQTLSSCQSQLEELLGRVEQAKSAGQSSTPYFESQIAAQNEMDKELTKVVEYSHQTIANSEENSRTLEQLSKELTRLHGLLEQEEHSKRKLAEGLDNQHERLIQMLEHREESESEPSGGLKNELEEELGQLSNTINQMLEFAKQMSVLSLNCAVEAGRMGETGRELLGAAEQVRSYSSQYEQSAIQAADRLSAVQDRLKQLEDLWEEQLGARGDSRTKLERLEQAMTDHEEIGSSLADTQLSRDVYRLSGMLQQLTQNQEAITALQKDTLSEMETIGESFMDEQEARGELERIFEQVLKKLESD